MTQNEGHPPLVGDECTCPLCQAGMPALKPSLDLKVVSVDGKPVKNVFVRLRGRAADWVRLRVESVS